MSAILDEARKMCEDFGEDFYLKKEYFEENQYAVYFPSNMIWAEPRFDGENSSWFVFLMIGEGSLPLFSRMLPFWLPNVSFYRIAKGRYTPSTLSLERLFKHEAIPLPKDFKPQEFYSVFRGEHSSRPSRGPSYGKGIGSAIS